MKQLRLILSCVTFCLAHITITNAQNCGRSNDKIRNEFMQFYEGQIPANNDYEPINAIIKWFKKNWNKDVNGSQKIGARALYFEKEAKGVVTSATQRLFISEITEKNKVKIALEKISGKAETEVCITTLNLETFELEERKLYTFKKGNNTEVKMFTLNNVLNCHIILNINGNSSLNSFKYRIVAKEVNETSENITGEFVAKPIKKKAKPTSKKQKQLP